MVQKKKKKEKYIQLKTVVRITKTLSATYFFDQLVSVNFLFFYKTGNLSMTPIYQQYRL